MSEKERPSKGTVEAAQRYRETVEDIARMLRAAAGTFEREALPSGHGSYSDAAQEAIGHLMRDFADVHYLVGKAGEADAANREETET